MLWSQSAPERRGQRAKSLGRAGGRGGQRSSWGFLHPWGPPHRLAAALAPIKQTAGKERLLQESDGKLIPRLFPGPFLLPRLLAGEVPRQLSGVPRAPAEILALISQTRKPSANSFSNGSGGRGVPWSPALLASSHGALQCPRALPKSSAFAGPAARGHAAGLARWGQRCLKVGDLQFSSAKPNSPCAGGHSRPVCPSARAAVVPPAPHALRLETWRNFL